MVSAIDSYAGSYSGMLEALKNRYAETDADGDGRLTLDEFEAGAPKGAPVDQSEMFSSLDADGDGSLSEEEFSSGLANRRPPPKPLSPDVMQQLAELFQSVDQDGDGSLTFEEFEAGAPEDAPDDLEGKFAEFDTDGDGLLSEDEFTSALSSRGPGGLEGPPPPPPGGGGPMALDDEEEDTLTALLEALFGEATESTAGSEADANDPIATLFQAFDQDGDGFLTQNETVAGFHALRSSTMEYLISLQDTGKSDTAA